MKTKIATLLIIPISILATFSIKILSVLAFETSNPILDYYEINERFKLFILFSLFISILYWIITFLILRILENKKQNILISTLLSLSIFSLSFYFFYQEREHYLAKYEHYGIKIHIENVKEIVVKQNNKTLIFKKNIEENTNKINALMFYSKMTTEELKMNSSIEFDGQKDIEIKTNNGFNFKITTNIKTNFK
jgi:hypothetical protein